MLNNKLHDKFQEQLCGPEGITCYQGVTFDQQPSLHTNKKTKSCLIECEGVYADVTKTKWGEIEIIDGVLSKFNKSGNHDLDVIYTPWEKIETVHGWDSNYEKYKFGLDEKQMKRSKTLDGKLLPIFEYLVKILLNKMPNNDIHISATPSFPQ